MNRFHRPLWLAAATATALAAVPAMGSSAQDAPTAAQVVPIAWTYNYKKGDVTRHRLDFTIKATAGGQDLSVVAKSVVRQEVIDVASNGDATVLSKPETMQVLLNGNPIPNDQAQQEVKEKRTRTGLTLPQTTPDPNDPTGQLAKVQTLLLNVPTPPTPVKVGDSWKVDVDNPLVAGKKVTINSTLAGAEKVAGIDTYKVRLQMSVPVSVDDRQGMSIENNYNVDAKAGRLVAEDFKLANVPLPGGAGVGTLQGHIALVVPGVNDQGDAAGAKTAPPSKP